MEKYYAVFDLQLDGFKSGHAGVDLIEVVKVGGQRVIELTQSDEEPLELCTDPLTALELYDYEIREVNKKDYQKILDCDNSFLSSVVSNVSKGKKIN